MCSVNEVKDFVKVDEDKTQNSVKYEIFSMISFAVAQPYNRR